MVQREVMELAMVVLLVVVILDCVSHSVSVSTQKTSFHMVPSKKIPLTFAQFFNCQTHVYAIILCEGFDATEA